MHTLENRYHIIETEMAPLISESRSTVYDVLKYHRKGCNKYEISTICNLTPLQVDTALAYIAERRDLLERELDEILEVEAAREAHYRQIAAEIQKKIDQQPMTPQRAAFYELRERNRQRREAERANHADCPERS